MNSRTDSIAAGYQTLTADASQQGSLPLLECSFFTQSMIFYSYPQCVQSSAQRLVRCPLAPCR